LGTNEQSKQRARCKSRSEIKVEHLLTGTGIQGCNDGGSVLLNRTRQGINDMSSWNWSFQISDPFLFPELLYSQIQSKCSGSEKYSEQSPV
jgi:hypothetical protein